jgi:branched-chain amino acid transport system ATP-binding protein
MSPVLEGSVLGSRRLYAGYGSVPVLHEIDMHVRPGEMVAVLGPNGAGKSTLIQCLAGVLQPMSGEVLLNGAAVRGGLVARSQAGVAYVREGRSIFPSLTVRDNLALGRGSVEQAADVIPALVPLMSRKAGLLSGGEQQYLTLARAIAGEPTVLLADELSLGLAPKIVTSLLQSARKAADAGAGVLFVEQHVRQALGIADRIYVLSRGRIALEGRPSDFKDRLDEIESAYLST